MTEPSQLADELTRGVGPMVDFVDNYPAQLIFYPQDKTTFLEEAQMFVGPEFNGSNLTRRKIS